MNLSDVMKLVNAGFSKTEIMSMLGQTEPEAASAPAEPEAPSAPAEPEAPTEPEAAPEPSAIDKLTAEVTRLTALVQKQNMLNTQQPEQKQVSPEDIIGQIIFPTYGTNK